MASLMRYVALFMILHTVRSQPSIDGPLVFPDEKKTDTRTCKDLYVAAAANDSAPHPEHHRVRRIINGEVVKDIKKYPFMAQVISVPLPGKTKGSPPFRCSGFLISSKYVLTAGHCLNPRLTTADCKMVVVLGTTDKLYDLDKPPSDTNIQIRTVPGKNFKSHESYNRLAKTINHDIAVIYLEKPVNLKTDYVKIIPLMQTRTRLPNDQRVTVLGWGAIKGAETQESLQFTSNLKAANGTITDGESCLSWGKRVSDGTVLPSQCFYRERELLCFHDDKNAICSGDSGGPMVIEDKFYNYVAVGIASWADPPLCRPKYPAVYVKVTAYWGWISKNTDIPYNYDRSKTCTDLKSYNKQPDIRNGKLTACPFGVSKVTDPMKQQEEDNDFMYDNEDL